MVQWCDGNNIGYPRFKLSGPSAEVEHRVEGVVASFESSSTCALSLEIAGGQQQTTSIMRALAPRTRGAVFFFFFPGRNVSARISK